MNLKVILKNWLFYSSTVKSQTEKILIYVQVSKFKDEDEEEGREKKKVFAQLHNRFRRDDLCHQEDTCRVLFI